MRSFQTVLALVVLWCVAPAVFVVEAQAPQPGGTSPAARPQSPTATSRATLLLQGVDKDLRVLDRAQLTGDDKKQRDRAKSLAQNARKLLQDARSDNDAEALSMATIASKDVGAVVRRELKLDRLMSAAEQYRAGDNVAAVQSLADSLASDLDVVVRYIEDNRDRLGVQDTGLADVNDRTVASLALVETEVAFRGKDDSGARLACVRRLLGVVNVSRLPGRFVERWYIAVAGHLQGQMHVMDAVLHVEEAVKRFPKDPEVLVVAGTFCELMASPGVELPARGDSTVLSYSPVRDERGARRAVSHVQPGGSNDGYDRLVAAKKMGFSRAEELYRGALAVNADNAEAHLRLGRVLFVTGRLDDALSELHLAVAGDDTRIRYLDSMFQGAVQEAVMKFDAAIACYQEAQRTCPKCLSAGLALSHAQRRSGDAAGAARTLNAAMQRDAETPFPDPWWDYPLGAFWRSDAVMRDLRGGLR